MTLIDLNTSLFLDLVIYGRTMHRSSISNYYYHIMHMCIIIIIYEVYYIIVRIDKSIGNKVP